MILGDLGSTLTGVSLVITAVVALLGWWSTQKARAAKKTATDAAGKVDAVAAKADELEAKAEGNKAVLDQVSRRVDERARSSGAFDRLIQQMQTMADRSVDLDQAMVAQLAASTDALANCEQREARSMERDAQNQVVIGELRQEVRTLSGRVTDLTLVVSSLSGGLTKPEPDTQGGT